MLDPRTRLHTLEKVKDEKLKLKIVVLL